jgi:hypothetical protein
MTDPPSHEASTPSGEPADADAVRDYLKKVSQVPGLSIEQETERHLAGPAGHHPGPGPGG